MSDDFETSMKNFIDRCTVQEYQDKCAGYFGKFLRRTTYMNIWELEDEMDVHLSDDEYGELLCLDLMVTGKLKALPDRPQIWVAMEISETINEDDVEHALQRAALFRKAGYPVLPAVGGKHIEPQARALAQEHGVVSLKNHIEFWDEAFERHYQ